MVNCKPVGKPRITNINFNVLSYNYLCENVRYIGFAEEKPTLQRHLGPVLNRAYRGINHFITYCNSAVTSYVIKIDRDTHCTR